MAKEKKKNKKGYSFPPAPNREEWGQFVEEYVENHLAKDTSDYNIYTASIRGEAERRQAAEVFYDVCFSRKGLERIHRNYIKGKPEWMVRDTMEQLEDVAVYLSQLSKDKKTRGIHHAAADHLARKWVEYRDKITDKELGEAAYIHYMKKTGPAKDRASATTSLHRQLCEMEKVNDVPALITPGNLSFKILTSLHIKSLHAMSKKASEKVLEKMGEQIPLEEILTDANTELMEAMGTYELGKAGFTTHLENRKQTLMKHYLDARFTKQKQFEVRQHTNAKWGSSGGDDDERGALWVDKVANDSRSPNAEAVMAEQNRNITKALETLDEREKKIIIWRFGLDGNEPRTLKEVGEEIGVTRERVRQIETKALKRLSWCDSIKGLNTTDVDEHSR